jgi:uncharacterized protein (TIGR03382 family)
VNGAPVAPAPAAPPPSTSAAAPSPGGRDGANGDRQINDKCSAGAAAPVAGPWLLALLAPAFRRRR